LGYGSKHVRFPSERQVIRGRNQHVRSNGTPKVRHETAEDAQAVVDEMRAEGKAVQRYQCNVCAGYHVGNRRHMEKVPDRDIALFMELGDRAFAHMRIQNGGRGVRQRAITKLCIRAIEKVLYPQ
jgi:hypothetical protein